MRIRVRILVRLSNHKKLNFYKKNKLKVGDGSQNIPTINEGRKAFLNETRDGGHEELISNGGRFKPVLLELSLARNLVKPLLSLCGTE